MSDLQHMTAANVRGWYQAWYAPNNAIVVVVGDVNPQQVFQLAKKYFGPIPAHQLPTMKPAAILTPKGEKNITVKAPAKLPWLIMGYNVPSLATAKDKWKSYALQVAMAILNGGNSSRLQKDLVRGSQIASSVSGNYNIYNRLPVLFILQGTPSPGHSVQQLKQAFLQQIKDLQQKPVLPTELQRVINQVVAQKVFAKDSLFYQAMQIGSLESVGLSWKDSENYVAEIKKITPAQVQAVAKEFLIPQRLTVAKLDPLPLHQPTSQKKTPVGGKNVQ